jgi:hypothetical protein
MTRGGLIPHACKRTSWRPVLAAGPDKSINAGLPRCTAIPSPSSPTLPPTSFARGTQVLPTTSSSLRLGLNVLGYSSARTDVDNNELLRGGAKRPGVNSLTWRNGCSHEQVAQLRFNASCWTATHDGTSQRPNTISFISFPLVPLPLYL